MLRRVKILWVNCFKAIHYCKTKLLSNRGNVDINAVSFVPIDENQYLPHNKKSTNFLSAGYDLSKTGNVAAVNKIETLSLPYKNIYTYWECNWYERLCQWMSRGMDIIIASSGLILFLPVFFVLSIIIKFESPGPVLYKQTRVGLNRRACNEQLCNRQERRKRDLSGKLFTIYKLRTMCYNAERNTGPVWARKQDKRVTSIGKLLRQTRFDELPQFINVLKNDMSIIGPRPERPEFVMDLMRKIPDFKKRHKVKPGITGLAQIKYRYTSSVAETKRKTKYDLFYLKKKSLVTDFYILLNTLPAVILGKGAQ